MEELSNEEIRRTIQSLVDITMCAICLETVQAEVCQCVNGHVICAECNQNLEMCPTCRGEFLLNAPTRFIAQVLEALPPRCKYRNCGKYLNETDDHQLFCGFKLINCKFKDCAWRGSQNAILEHAMEIHENNVIIITGNKDIQFVLYENIFNPDANETYTTLYSIEGQFIWHIVASCADKKELKHTFTFVPNDKPKHTFHVKITSSSTSNEVKFMYKIKLNMDLEAQNEESKNCICIPKCMLSRLVEGENISFDVVFKTTIQDCS